MYTLQHINLLKLYGSLSTALLRRLEKCSLFEAKRILKNIMNDYDNVQWDGPYKISLLYEMDNITGRKRTRKKWKNVYKP